MYRHLLVPIDDSALSVETVRQAVTFAGTLGAKVTFFHANADYGAIEVEDRLANVTQPVLVLAGRGDRTCVVEGAEAMARGLRHAELIVFEESGHMTYVEENEKYLNAVRTFLNDHIEQKE